MFSLFSGQYKKEIIIQVCHWSTQIFIWICISYMGLIT